VAQGQHGVPADETDGLTQQQPGHHPTQEHQVALIGEPDVLTQDGDQLTMEPGLGIHEGLDWSDNPKLPWLPDHPKDLRPMLLQEFSDLCRPVSPVPPARG